MALVNKNIIEEGVNRLLHQFKNKPKIVTFLSSILGQLQESEDSKFEHLIIGVSIQPLGILWIYVER